MAIYIRTIAEFMALPEEGRSALLKAVDTGARLRRWLERGDSERPFSPRPCLHCIDHPGEERHYPRNNADIHPSKITACLKYLWYCCSGYADLSKESIDAKLRVTFDLGKAWHRWVQVNYGKRGAWGNPDDYYDEVPMNPDASPGDDDHYGPSSQYRIRGSIDAIQDNYHLGRVPYFADDVIVRCGHEYKTINENGYARISKPKEEHNQQATLYGGVTDTPIWSFVYFNKNGGVFTDFTVPVDLEVWGRLQQRCATVLEKARSGTQFDWMETAAVLNPSECKKCPLGHVCKPWER